MTDHVHNPNIPVVSLILEESYISAPTLTTSANQDDNWDKDSAYGESSDLDSITTSLRSSITDFHYENGRRYHAYRAGAYWGPNDELMADAMDIAHHIYTIMQGGKLHLAPIQDPQRALDVGTGTGIWAIDFADFYPNCQVVGSDLSPTQPQEIPPNLQFEVDDCCSEWVYTKTSFDYVHVRGLYGSVASWGEFYAQAMRHLKPGGYYEQMEVSVAPVSEDGSVCPDSIFDKWGKTSIQAGEAFGKTLDVINIQKQGLIDAGFEDVVEHRFKVPIGGWSKDRKLKELGMYNRLYWEQGLEGWCLYLLTRYLGWTYEEIQVYVAEMRKMLRNKSMHAYHECGVVYGRKPFESHMS